MSSLMHYNERMYTLSNSLLELPILSLQTGQSITQTSGVIIDSSSLTIVALTCGETEGMTHPIILIRDIREFATDCILVNSDDDISESEDIVRLKTLLDKPFNLMNIRVATESGHRLGRVEDYTINTENFQIQKLYVHPALLKGVFGSSLIIDRDQISDVTPKLITVKETTTSLPAIADITPPIKS